MIFFLSLEFSLSDPLRILVKWPPRGVVDTGEQFFGGVVDTGDKF